MELTYTPAGSSASLSDASQPSPSFTADLDGEYVAVLVVNDGTVDSSADMVTITATASGPDGAQLFADYCGGCHSASSLRGKTDDDIKSILPHKLVTIDDIGGSDGAKAIADFLNQ